jgi:hypothetical protein
MAKGERGLPKSSCRAIIQRMALGGCSITDISRMLCFRSRKTQAFWLPWWCDIDRDVSTPPRLGGYLDLRVTS